MRFYSTPNMSVTHKDKYGRISLVAMFDENGIFETNDILMIGKMKKCFKFEEEEKRKCKKCDFSCDNQGDLLVHYRKNHKEDK